MKTTVIVVLIVVAVVVGGLWNMGFFQKVDFKTEQAGPLNTVYLEHTGPYHKISSKIEEVKKYLDENKISYTESFGEYLDDPAKVKAQDLKSNGGFIVEKLPRVKAPLAAKTLPKKTYATATFNGSPMVGAFMVYPRAMKWLAANNLEITSPVIEIYKMEGKKMSTKYLFPVTPKKGTAQK
jgi:effector-binding domain-containing protein